MSAKMRNDQLSGHVLWKYFKQREQYNFDISRHVKSIPYKKVVICSVEMCLNGISVLKLVFDQILMRSIS